MADHFFSRQLVNAASHPLIADLQALYRQMDQAWHRVAQLHGFECHGCDENCCQTFFFHHTHIECALLYSGFQQLPEKMRQLARQRADAVADGAAQASLPRQMCPLNIDDRCMAYRWRPMICRLHGVPHRFPKSGGYGVGPGCKAFYQSAAADAGPQLDRTPFYRSLAQIEAQFKKDLDLTARFKMTVAQMICHWPSAARSEP
jgi:hypothetical protein